MDNVLVSIIIPVYNTEKYIERCLNSIIEQTYEDIEIILINDGSTDNSGKICEKYKSIDSRIKIINQKNRGVVISRNKGIQEAQGEYITFVDSDDWVEKNMIEDTLNIAIRYDCDVVSYGYMKEDMISCDILYDGVPEGFYGDDSSLNKLYSNMFYNNVGETGIITSVCLKLIKASVLKSVYMKISQMQKYFEDTALTYLIFMNSENIFVQHKSYYHYIMRNGSATHSNYKYILRDLNDFYVTILDFIEGKNYYKEVKKGIDAFMVKNVFIVMKKFMNIISDVPNYIMPPNIIPNGSHIVLYGAGEVGKSYYNYIISNKWYDLVKWVDKRYDFYRKDGLNVYPVESIKTCNWDYIVLAVKYKTKSDEMRDYLVKHFQIENEKIVWVKPQGLLDVY